MANLNIPPQMLANQQQQQQQSQQQQQPLGQIPVQMLNQLPMIPPYQQPAIQQAAAAAVANAQIQPGVVPPVVGAGGNQAPLKDEENPNGFFNDLLSPFFAPYGIDVSHFPLTNPPIFESAMMYNQQGQPRRRISISNGQIGQITNHQDDDSPPEDNDSSNVSANNSMNAATSVPPPPLGMNNSVPPPPPNAVVNSQGADPLVTNAQGVPTQKLIYNNEVIFNPEAGPIPGTAAWKKARLLERNRVAASKCRQRKKAAQMQLKENVEKYTMEIDSLKHSNKEMRKKLELLKRVAEKQQYSDILEILG